MPLTKSQKTEIESTIRKSLLNKLKKYRPETNYMPFHYRLLGKDRMALFSFIHSLNTTFGTSIYEPVAEELALGSFKSAKKQYSVGDSVTEKAQTEIQKIMNELSMGSDPDKKQEIERIRKVCRTGKTVKQKKIKVDLFIEETDGTVHLFDLKTAKPNVSNFKDFKRTLLEWTAAYLSENPEANVMSYIAIPYNPYYPKPYQRWTMKGMLDIESELKVDSQFWDFLGGGEVFDELLHCFERAGKKLRPEIDDYFKRFA